MRFSPNLSLCLIVPEVRLDPEVLRCFRQSLSCQVGVVHVHLLLLLQRKRRRQRRRRKQDKHKDKHTNTKTTDFMRLHIMLRQGYGFYGIACPFWDCRIDGIRGSSTIFSKRGTPPNHPAPPHRKEREKCGSNGALGYLGKIVGNIKVLSLFIICRTFVSLRCLYTRAR